MKKRTRPDTRPARPARGGRPDQPEFRSRPSDRRDDRRDERRDGRRDERRDDRRPAFERPSNVIFGVLPVLELLRANNRRVEKIVVADGAREGRISEIIELAREQRVPFQKQPREALSRLTGPDANNQGVVAFAAAADYTDADELVESLAAADKPLALVLDGVEDPRNLGALLRVAECAGVHGTFIPEHRAVGLTETVVKTAAGATEYAKIAKVRNLNRLIEELKENNIWVVGTSGEATMDYTEWNWDQPCALVMGGEGKGLHRLVAENCDALVKIPMLGKIESLNVSVAAGVVLFEAVRQRGKS